MLTEIDRLQILNEWIKEFQIDRMYVIYKYSYYVTLYSYSVYHSDYTYNVSFKIKKN